MGNDCCADRQNQSSNPLAVFKDLKIKQMSCKEILTNLMEYFSGPTKAQLLFSNFTAFTDKFCLAYSGFDTELELFWIKFFENMPDKTRNRQIIICFLLLSDNSDQKSNLLSKIIAPEAYKQNYEEVYVTRRRLFDIIMDYIQSFTLLTLKVFEQCYESKKEYDFLCEEAFTEDNIYRFIEIVIFEGYENSKQIDLIDFLDRRCDKLKEVYALSLEIVNFTTWDHETVFDVKGSPRGGMV